MNYFKIAASLSLFVISGAVCAQSVAVLGHVGSIVDPHGTPYATNGYLECEDGCNLAHGTPDANVMAILTYADQNNLPGIVFGNDSKIADICNVNYTTPSQSVCMEYQSSEVDDANQVATSWTGVSSFFVSLDVCLQYYPHGGGVAPRLHWPTACGAFPATVTNLPAPPTTFIKELGTLLAGTTCWASWTGAEVCGKLD